MKDPLQQDEEVTLEAELRQALQHRRAAEEQARQTREELAQLISRAQGLLDHSRSGDGTAEARADGSEEQRR